MKISAVAATILALLWTGCGPALAQGALKVGVFDPQRVSEEALEGKRVQAELTALRDRRQAELAARERELTDLQSQLSAEQPAIASEKRALLEREVQRKGLELRQAREAAGSELQLELASAQNRFQDKLLAAVAEFGREQGFALILDRSMAAYAADDLDVTASIVRQLDAATKKQDTSKPAAGPNPAPGSGGR